VTNDLVRRVYEHRNNLVEGFTRRYRVHKLVHFESYGDPRTAIQREKNLKHWVRAWKIELIERANPTWRDLYDEIATN
jgi:putative endonuclease